MRSVLVLLGACGFHGSSDVVTDGTPLGDAMVAADAAAVDHDAQMTIDAATHDDAGVSTALVCPTSANWIVVGSAHYFISPNNDDKTWWDAETDCESKKLSPGSAIHLATFTSNVETLALASHLIAQSSWVGMFQPLGESTPLSGWEWITGGGGLPLDWQLGEPNDGNSGGEDGTENFAAIYMTTGTLNDNSGDAVFHYVCRCDGVPVSAAAAAMVPADENQQ